MAKPKLPEEQRRKNLLKIYLSESEYKEVTELSEKVGLSLSHLGRNLITGAKIESLENYRQITEMLKAHNNLKQIAGLLGKAMREGQSKAVISGMIGNIEKMLVVLSQKIHEI